MNDTLEHTARKIADRGRDALIERLRPAFAEAASAHADLLKIDDEQLEDMVQRAADKADGLQWRRALAGVATEELGIGLGEALSHPAVARAQVIVGAPAYEDSLKGLRGTATPSAEHSVAEKAAEGSAVDSPSEAHAKASEVEPTAEPEPDEAKPVAEDEAEPAAEPEPEPEAEEVLAEDAATELDEAEPAVEAEPEAKAEHPAVLRIPAVHLGGVANLGSSEGDIELRFSDKGLEIVRQNDEAALARMRWPEIQAVDVPVLRRRLLRRGPPSARLIIHSSWGEANFEIPGFTPDELHDELAPIVTQQR